MKREYWVVIVFCLIISIGSIIYFYGDNNFGSDYYYKSTGKFIKGNEVFEVHSTSKVGLPAERPIVLFANSEYKYVYSVGFSNDEHVVKKDGEYIYLSRYIVSDWVRNDELEESGIGERVYWEDIE